MALVLTVLSATACNSRGTPGAADAGRAFTPPKLPALEQLGSGEGALSVLSRAGYAEDGSTDPEIDWVTPFEQATG